jgi:hypothetical protein
MKIKKRNNFINENSFISIEDIPYRVIISNKYHTNSRHNGYKCRYFLKCENLIDGMTCEFNFCDDFKVKYIDVNKKILRFKTNKFRLDSKNVGIDEKGNEIEFHVTKLRLLNSNYLPETIYRVIVLEIVNFGKILAYDIEMY